MACAIARRGCDDRLEIEVVDRKFGIRHMVHAFSFVL
jgi:hypothetical protein